MSPTPGACCRFIAPGLKEEEEAADVDPGEGCVRPGLCLALVPSYTSSGLLLGSGSWCERPTEWLAEGLSCSALKSNGDLSLLGRLKFRSCWTSCGLALRIVNVTSMADSKAHSLSTKTRQERKRKKRKEKLHTKSQATVEFHNY